jgi:hypothetical protein
LWSCSVLPKCCFLRHRMRVRITHVETFGRRQSRKVCFSGAAECRDSHLS